MASRSTSDLSLSASHRRLDTDDWGDVLAVHAGLKPATTREGRSDDSIVEPLAEPRTERE